MFSNLDDHTGKLLPTIVRKGHKWTADATGTYMVCVDNTIAKWTAKVRPSCCGRDGVA